MPKSDSRDCFSPSLSLLQSFAAAAVRGFHSCFVFPQRKMQPAYRNKRPILTKVHSALSDSSGNLLLLIHDKSLSFVYVTLTLIKLQLAGSINVFSAHLQLLLKPKADGVPIWLHAPFAWVCFSVTLFPGHNALVLLFTPYYLIRLVTCQILKSLVMVGMSAKPTTDNTIN